MEFLLKLLVTAWFFLVLFVTYKLAFTKVVRESKKLNVLDFVLLTLATVMIGFGLNTIWFILKIDI